MKTLFITVSEPAVAFNILRTSFWNILTHVPDLRIVLLSEPSKVAYYRERFGKGRVVVEPVASGSEGFVSRALAFLARNGFRSGITKIMQERAYARGETRIPPWVKNTIAFLFGGKRWYVRLLRFLEVRFVQTTPTIRSLFKRYQPDLVFTTILRGTAMDIDVAREARRRDIFLVGMVRSWDNLTSYGYLRIIPDLFVAQNEFLKEIAITKHFIDPAHIVVTGLPHYDRYVHNTPLETREAFCAKLGLDPTKKFILYGAIGDYLFSNEGTLAPIFERLIDTGVIAFPAQVVFRAHPAFDSPLETMQNLSHVFPDRVATYTSSSRESWEMEENDFAHLINSLYHADVLVTTGSTLMIDGAAFDTPVISIAFDGEKNEPYWFSVARFHDTADHVRAVLTTGGVRVAHTIEELATHINVYLSDDTRDRSGRREIIKRFASPLDGHSGERLADIILTKLT